MEEKDDQWDDLFEEENYSNDEKEIKEKSDKNAKKDDKKPEVHKPKKKRETYQTKNLKYDDEEHELKYDDDEWKKVEFHLKSSVPTEVKINKIIIIQNGLTESHFAKIKNNHLWAYGWYNLKGLDYKKELIKMRNKTFEIPEKGLNIKVGSLYEKSNVFEVESIYIFCRIYIGKSFCRIKQEGEKEDPPKKLKNPYDCFMYCTPEQSAKSQKMCWSITKPYSYYIKKREYIEPLYCVFFSAIKSNELNEKNKYICEECHEKEAEIYCRSCIKYICNTCQEKVHASMQSGNKEKGESQHKTVPILSSTRPGYCCNHPTKEGDFYCSLCKRVICGFCKYLGSHSTGYQKNHEVETIYSKFDTTGNKILAEYQEKKSNGNTSLEKISEQIKVINNNLARFKSDLEIDFKEKREIFENLANQKKKMAFTYISCLKDLKYNLIYLNTYFKERENFLIKYNKKAELAFIWNVHRNIISKLIDIYNKKRNENEIKSKLDDFMLTFTTYQINRETFNANTKNVQSTTEKISNNEEANHGGYEEEQINEYYDKKRMNRELMLKYKNAANKAFDTESNEMLSTNNSIIQPTSEINLKDSSIDDFNDQNTNENNLSNLENNFQMKEDEKSKEDSLNSDN